MARLKPVSRGASGAVDIYLDGPVGFPEEGGMTAAMFREQLRAANGAALLVHFNSEGGIVTQGMAMFNALRAYKGRKVGVVDGLAASIASVVLMACDEIRVAKGAYVMIHNPSGGAKGGAEDLRSAADTLESMRSELLDIYEARTGIERAKLEKMLDAETYFTAEEAVQAGIADKVEAFEAHIQLTAVARLNPEKVPAELRAAAKGKEKNMKPKMKAKIEAKEAELAALRAKAEAGDDAPEDSDDDDTEDKPEDSDDDDEPEDSEDDDDKKEGEKALLATVYTLTGSKSPAVALGKLAGIVSKGVKAALGSRADLVTAAVKAGILAPALAKQAKLWPEKTWNTFLASAGGTKALKLGPTHTPPLEPVTPPLVPGNRGTETDKQKIARLTGVKVEDLDKAPACAPQLKGGSN